MAEGFTCAVEEWYRSACEGLGFYGEHERKRYCVLHFPGEKNKEDLLKVKERKVARKDYDFRGTVFPEGTANFKGFQFDANANFTNATFIGGALFSGEETSFSRAQFSGEETYFSGAQFSGESTLFVGAQFSAEETSFSRAQFSAEWTYFSEAQFSGKLTSFSGAEFSSGEQTFFITALFSAEWTSFSGAQFSGGWADFARAQFGGGYTDFSGAQFRSAETDFREATFVKEVDFAGATFSEKVAFRGSKANPVFGYGAWAWFNRCRIEKPEQLTFNTVLLHPCWFINADVRKVDFTDVAWYGMPGGPEGSLNGEIAALEKRGVAAPVEKRHALEERGVRSPYTLLAQTCRRLSANAEENREYPLANEFYYWSMNALRKAGWRRLGLIGTLYWALSGYGVRAARAFGWLVVIWFVFALLYMLMGSKELHVFSASEAWKYVAQHIRTNPLGLRAPSHSEIKHFWADVRPALVYSLGALARLRPEPQPGGPSWFQFFVTVEGILGPLQIALLALAVRRKVMR